MNRRGFLQLLGLAALGLAAAPVLALDPERRLWVPGAKTIFLPPVRGFAYDQWITHETVRLLEQRLQFERLIRQRYEGSFQTGTRIVIG